MVFSSVFFIFLFLPITLFFYYTINPKYKNHLLLITSLIFYFWGEGKYLLVMLLFMVFNYFFGILMEYFFSSKNNRIKVKVVFISALVFNLGFLLFFKYFDFFIINLNKIISPFATPLKVPNIHLPLGISFFSFQAISYIIDIYRRDVVATSNFINFSMYKSFFPQLIAGPIVRYKDLALQIKTRNENIHQFSEGVWRFIIGLGKKVLIANNVAVLADSMFNSQPAELSFLYAWAGVFCYALQIYYDFSGYSDMAIGLAKMFGFDFLENFNYPYISNSIREFWQRWHISLSTWFRDYLYISLGGNRVSKYRIYLNLLTVFFLCGLWHGASWTFVVWGLWHGFFLVFERTKFGRILNILPRYLSNLYTLLVVLLGWVFFRANSMSHASHIFKALFTIHRHSELNISFINFKIISIMIMGIVGSMPIFRIINKFTIQKFESSYYLNGFLIFKVMFAITIFLFSMAALSTTTYNPFIYFRF